MEVSINSSKRKFQSLLDNITNAAKNEPTPKHGKKEQSTRDRPLKRPRLGQSHLEEDGRIIKVARHKRNADTDSTSRRNQYNHKCHAKPITSTDERDNSLVGTYAPWSREAFLKRLNTFADPHLWTVKPDAINEFQWAKRGWICEDKETVACKGQCEQRLVIDLGPSQQDNELPQSDNDDEKVQDIHQLEDTFAQKYQELVISAHSEHCLWRKSGCKEDIYRLPLLRFAFWRSSLIRRYESLVHMADMLPKKLNMPEVVDVERAAALILSESVQQDVPKSHISPTAFRLALCGWKGDLIGEVAISRCESCFQRIGLWLYIASEEEDGNINNGTDSDHREVLDPIASHKYYCPWINANTQYASGKYSGKAGWEILQDIILQNRAEPVISYEAHDEVEERHDAISVEIKDDARLSKLQQLKKIFNFKKRK